MAKIDLVEFQKQLNEQFLEIDSISLDAVSFSNEVIEDNYNNELGIIYDTDNFKFFFSLKNFKHISVSANFEPVFFTKRWLLGFIHFRGAVYSVVDLYNILNDQKSRKVNKSDSLLFFKTLDNTRVAIANNNVSLEHAGEYTPIFSLNEAKDGWVKNEEIEDVFMYLREKNMSAREYEVIKEMVSGAKRFDNEKFTFFKFIKDVYVDAYGKRPIFVLDAIEVLKHINDAVPF